MKKVLSSIIAVALVCSFVFLFASCGSTLKGTYKASDSLGGTLTFDKDNKVTGELFGITLDGTYEIEDDQITFSYSGAFGIGATLTKSFEKDGSTLIIDGKEFVKQK
ncbi:MAG: META domain-containing protein [Clostridia bacterium]|nr:META domain-containing protein [Clostridia bacterium]